MPQFFFHLTGLTIENTVENEDGENFDHVAEAKGHAVRVAQELGRNNSALDGRFVTVTDEHGVVVFKTGIHDR